MAEAKTLAASVRSGVGKGAARSVRREGRIPAVVYGGGAPPQPVALSWHEVNKMIYAGGFMTSTFDLDIDGSVERVIPRDYQLEPLKGAPLHVDFLRLKKGQKIDVEIPVHAHGQDESIALKNGGVLNMVRHVVELNVAADSIPENVIVDVTGLAIGDTIHIADLKLPRGTRLTNAADAEFTVLTIQPPLVEPELDEVEPAETAVEGAEDASADEAAGEGSEAEGGGSEKKGDA